MKYLIYGAAIFILSVVVFSGSLTCGLTNWDDPLYVSSNPLIRDFSARGMWKIVTSFHYGAYKPIVFLSYALDYRLGGLSPFVYHLHNVILHAFNGLLVFILILLLSKNSSVAFLTALFFGLHPLKVESVAWISERKDLLFSFFYLGSLILWLKSRVVAEKKFLGISLVCFALSLAVKPMGIALPLVFVLLDSLKFQAPKEIFWLRKQGYYALSAAAILVNAAGHFLSPAKQSIQWVWLSEGLLRSSWRIFFYLAKLAAPFELSALYPFISRAQVYSVVPILCFVALLVVLFIVWKYRKKDQALFFGAGFFLINLLLVLPVFFVSSLMAADRYTYLPSIGLFYILAAWFFSALRFLPVKFLFFKRLILILPFLLLGFYAALTMNRVGVWRDSLSLWDDVIMKNPVPAAYVFRAGALQEKGRLAEAVQDLNRALGMKPDLSEARVLLGNIYLDAGDPQEALFQYSLAIDQNPYYAAAFYNRGNAYFDAGRMEEAISDFTKAIDLKKDYVKAYENRGLAWFEKKMYLLALKDFERALELDPGSSLSAQKREVCLFCLKGV